MAKKTMTEVTAGPSPHAETNYIGSGHCSAGDRDSPGYESNILHVASKLSIDVPERSQKEIRQGLDHGIILFGVQVFDKNRIASEVCEDEAFHYCCAWRISTSHCFQYKKSVDMACIAPL